MNSSTKSCAVEDHEKLYLPCERIIIAVVIGLLIVAALFGNILTIVAFIKKKFYKKTQPLGSHKNTPNYFIFSLALADIVVALYVVSFHTVYMIENWPYKYLNYHSCLLWLTVDYWFFQVSVFGVLLVAGDRYLSMKFPNTYPRWVKLSLWSQILHIRRVFTKFQHFP